MGIVKAHHKAHHEAHRGTPFQTVAEACAWEHDFLNSFYRYASPGNTAVCTHIFAHGTGGLPIQRNAVVAAPFAVSAMFPDLCPLSEL